MDSINRREWDIIKTEIWQPELIVMPIPKDELNTSAYMKIQIDITNNTRNSFLFDPIATLNPEILTLEQQVLPSISIINKDEEEIETDDGLKAKLSKLTYLISKFIYVLSRKDNGVRVDPGTHNCKSIDINARLTWQDNLLELKVYYINHSQYNITKKYWFFQSLHPGIYQLRFIYLPLHKNTTISSIIEVMNRQKRNLGQLATSLINLHLVQPIEPECSAVEVEGIRFETVIPEKLLKIPHKERGAGTPVEMGIRITNNTQTPCRFDLFACLIPELLGVNGQALWRSYYSNILLSPKKSDYPLVMSGESITRFPKAKLWWCRRDRLRLEIVAGDGGFWIFEYLISGTYKFRFLYRKYNYHTKENDNSNTITKSLDWRYSTTILTPFHEVILK